MPVLQPVVMIIGVTAGRPQLERQCTELGKLTQRMETIRDPSRSIDRGRRIPMFP